MLLILEHLLPELVPLVHQCLMLPSQFLVIALALARQVLLDLVCKVLVQVLRHLQLLLHDL